MARVADGRIINAGKHDTSPPTRTLMICSNDLGSAVHWYLTISACSDVIGNTTDFKTTTWWRTIARQRSFHNDANLYDAVSVFNKLDARNDIPVILII